ncbi:hypothetical protein EI94DRAFT_1696224 [Lactarius quietus]|nr:hypothetical protein EI94DRAFT_1696224 [Lactarius quietus]
MPNDAPSPYTPRPQNGPHQGAEVKTLHLLIPLGYYPYIQISRSILLQILTATCPGRHALGRNDASYGDWAQYPNYAWNESLAPPSVVACVSVWRDPNHGYAPPGNAQHYLAAPASPPVGYYMPPVHMFVSEHVCTWGVPNNVPPTAMPDVADPFSRNFSNSDSNPFRTSAMADLKHLANHYLHNPNSRVDTLRMGLSSSGRRFMVMILLKVDDIV